MIVIIRLDDDWCKEACDAVKDVKEKVLVTSLNRKYSRQDCAEFDLIASCTTGTDHIDNGDVPLISLKGDTDFLKNIHATAEHTFALILAVLRKVPAAFEDVKAGNWDRDYFQGTELHGKTIGIIGYGRVGQQVHKIANGFGAKVVPYDPYQRIFSEDNGELYELKPTLEWVLSNSDIITVHVPLNDETRGMFGPEQFALMKPTAYFINTSRGAVVDEAALWHALSIKRIAGAAIDVCAGEPDFLVPALRSYAREHYNLIITPHIGGNTAESRRATQLYIANKILKFYKECE